jgi:two-component system response regulator DevR
VGTPSKASLTAFLVVSAGLEGEALEALLERSGVRVVGSDTPARASGDVSIDADVVLVDARSPDGLNAVHRLAAASVGPKQSVIALGDPDEGTLAECVAAGAGYVARGSAPQHLLTTLEAAAHGELVCSAGAARALKRQSEDVLGHAALANRGLFTAREWEIVGLVAQGLTDKEIGRRLYIARSTVKKHVGNIFSKLDVHRRSEVAAALRREHDARRR